MHKSRNFSFTSAAVLIAMILGVNSTSGEPKPSPKLDTPIGEAFTRIKDSIGKEGDPRSAQESHDQHALPESDRHSKDETTADPGDHQELDSNLQGADPALEGNALQAAQDSHGGTSDDQERAVTGTPG